MSKYRRLMDHIYKQITVNTSYRVLRQTRVFRRVPLLVYGGLLVLARQVVVALGLVALLQQLDPRLLRPLELILELLLLFYLH